MERLIDYLLEILKITLPAFIVFLTVYYLMREFFKAQLQMKNMELRAKGWGDTIPLKVQAFERLALFLERIRVQNLIIRLEEDHMNVKELKAVLLIGLQQEYDHNVSQRLYVSEKLWEIISLAKFEVTSMIAEAANEVSDNSVLTFKQNILKKMDERSKDPVDIAIGALKSEVGSIL